MKLSITDFFSKCDQIRNLLEVLKTKKVSDFYFLLLGSDKVFILKTIHPENPKAQFIKFLIQILV